VRFSRHARRRANLYKIPESMIRELVVSSELNQGVNNIIKFLPGLKYPIKIIVDIEGDTATVITSYPLKKGLDK
jgi:hypothetical protein